MLYWRPYETIIVRAALGGFLVELPQFTDETNNEAFHGVYRSIFLEYAKNTIILVKS